MNWLSRRIWGRGRRRQWHGALHRRFIAGLLGLYQRTRAGAWPLTLVFRVLGTPGTRTFAQRRRKDRLSNIEQNLHTAFHQYWPVHTVQNAARNYQLHDTVRARLITVRIHTRTKIVQLKSIQTQLERSSNLKERVLAQAAPSAALARFSHSFGPKMSAPSQADMRNTTPPTADEDHSGTLWARSDVGSPPTESGIEALPAPVPFRLIARSRTRAGMRIRSRLQRNSRIVWPMSKHAGSQTATSDTAPMALRIMQAASMNGFASDMPDGAEAPPDRDARAAFGLPSTAGLMHSQAATVAAPLIYRTVAPPAATIPPSPDSARVSSSQPSHSTVALPKDSNLPAVRSSPSASSNEPPPSSDLVHCVADRVAELLDRRISLAREHRGLR